MLLLWFHAMVKKEAVLGGYFQPVKGLRLRCKLMKPVVKKEQIWVIVLNHPFLLVTKPWFCCDFMQWLERGSFWWLF